MPKQPSNPPKAILHQALHMNSEGEVLKSVWKSDGKGSARDLAAATNFGIDYTRYLLGELQKKKLIASRKNQKGLFCLTSRGKRRLAAIGFIAQVPGRVTRTHARRVEKKYEINVRPSEAAEDYKVTLIHNLNESTAGEQKVSIGGAIEKAARYLKDLLREDNSL